MRAEFYRPELNGTWHVREFWSYTTDMRALEQLFEAFNVGTCDDDFELSDEAARYRRCDTHARSMSVGDVVVLIRDLAPGERPLRLAYKCEAHGWSRTLDPAGRAGRPRHFSVGQGSD